MGLIDGAATRNAASLLGWTLPAAIALVSLACLAGGDDARMALRFDRSGILDGDAWRLLSGHVVHLGASHWALNVVGLGLVWYLVGEAFDVRRWLIICLLAITAIDAGLWWLNPGLQWYVGLSGLLHGMLAAGIAGVWGRRRSEAILLAAVVAVKLGYEQIAGPLPGSELASGAAVVVDAHLYGATGGVAAALGLISLRRGAPI